MREYRIQCETDPMPAGQQPIGSAHTPNPVTSSPHDLQGPCPLTCNGTANNPQSSTVARSHSMELATESPLPRWVCVARVRDACDSHQRVSVLSAPAINRGFGRELTPGEALGVDRHPAMGVRIETWHGPRRPSTRGATFPNCG